MIPKVIHYCWFGGKELPDSAKFCIESWKRNCLDYTILEWNEDNFDINSHQFVKECYEAKKYGFIVDVLRAYVLKIHGGIYLDTDVQILKPFDSELLNTSAFLCYEDFNMPNVGLVASVKDGLLVSDILELYKDKHFLNEGGSINDVYTGPVGFAEVIKSRGHVLNGQVFDDPNYLRMYSQDFFCAKSYSTGIVSLTYNTYAVHHYDASWFSEDQLNFATISKHYKRIEQSTNYIRKNLNKKEYLKNISLYTDLSLLDLCRIFIIKTYRLLKKSISN